MEQLNLFEAKEEKILTVSEVNHRTALALKDIPELRNCWVAGEISRPSHPSNGHCYFTLKDENKSELKAVIWRSKLTAEMNELLENGNAVEAHGYISVYETGGCYQLNIDRMRPRGRGSVFEEYEKLKRKLDAEGLFAEERKRRLPEMPRTIGIVSSPSAAGLQDMLNIFRDRWTLSELLFSPAIVQGTAAPASIIAALKKLYAIEPDVIILARGGGSMEDLWCFNDEQVVRTVAASPVPIITGVGHEIDYTLVDFASDYRAPTPTAAAVAAVPNITDVLASLTQMEYALDDAMDGKLNDMTQSLDMLSQRLDAQSPENRIKAEARALEQMTARLGNAEKAYTTHLNDTLNAMTKRLELLNPSNVMRRGYAFVRRNATVITSANDLNAGDRIAVRFYDGEKTARVE